jgi:exopolysaccharide biosynthesis WecB/TagA/CpsF family protein
MGEQLQLTTETGLNGGLIAAMADQRHEITAQVFDTPHLDTRAGKDFPAPQELREFIGLRFWDVDLGRMADFLVQKALAGERLNVFFVNAHCINVAAHNPSYAKLLKDTPFLFADGVGLALAARICGVPLNNNVNGTDLFPKICLAAAAASLPIAFLGARPSVARRCAEHMERQFPGLRVAWTEHGYLSGKEEDSRIPSLNSSDAKILFVAKGVPTQETWIAANSERLAPPIILGVGALFDFYSGAITRAPQFIRDLRLEWLYRLLREPRRLFRRYVLGNPAFIARMVLWRLLSR